METTNITIPVEQTQKERDTMNVMRDMSELRNIGLETIQALETADGILASDRNEIYGCTFGRDSAITGLKLLTSYEKTRDPYILALVKKIIGNLSRLQGAITNIENGEEPGKIIHEFREHDHKHLTVQLERPWFTQPDGTLKNYDSVDSTLLYLMLVARYYKASQDHESIASLMQSVRSALEWTLRTMDTHEHGFVSYTVSSERTCGGLNVQSWMDSEESLFHEDNTPAPYPIAPLEAQAYAYAALGMWSREFAATKQPEMADELRERSSRLKAAFNEYFVHDTQNDFIVAFAIDGTGRPMLSARSSMGHILWTTPEDCILEAELIPKLVARLMRPDLFVPQAGIRTLSSMSSHFDPQSYHNGSIWPHDTGITAEGFANFGYLEEASALRHSLREAWSFFGSPIELYTYIDNRITEYRPLVGHGACRKQAWSAASMLAEL